MADTYATWNPSDKDAGITLSGGNLIATKAGGWAGVRATIGKSAGKWYWEVKCTGADTGNAENLMGIGRADATLYGPGTDTKGWVREGGGKKRYNNSSSAYSDAMSSGDVIGFALNLDTGKIWTSRNGTWTGDPVAGTGEMFAASFGTVFPHIGSSKALEFTANFGASAFAYSVPSGFESGWFTPGDTEIVAEPLVADARLSGATLQAFLSGALAATGGLSCADLFIGRFVAAEPLKATAGLAGKISLDYAPPALSATAALSGALMLPFVAEALKATAGLGLSELFIGRFVEAEPLAVTAGLDGKIEIQIQPPALAVTAVLSGEAALHILSGALGALAQLSALGQVVFIDRDYRILYRCYLDDLEIPITSFQGRFKSGDPSFLSVVVPGMDLAAEIAARAGGTLTVYAVKEYRSGHETSEILGSVVNDEIRIDEGVTSQSITIDGHRTTTHTPKAVTLSGSEYRATYGGATRVRCTPDFYLRPGDTVTIDDDTFVVQTITWYVNESGASMEVSEA